METKFEIIAKGKQREFLLPFMAYRFEDVKVYINNKLQTKGYSLSGLAQKQGVKLVFLQSPGSQNHPVTLKAERLSRISPWVRFYDHEPLKADMLNANTDHSYAILQDHRRLCDQIGDIDYRLLETDKLLNHTQALHVQTLGAKDNAQKAMIKAQEAAKKAEAISNLEAESVRIKNGILSPSITNVQQGLNGLAFSVMPVGSLLIWFFNRVPQGFLRAAGQLLKRSDYSELWEVVRQSNEAIAENQWGGRKGCFSLGDGRTNFRLPDLRDYFIRGITESRPIGSHQNDEIRSHNHQIIRTKSFPGDNNDTDYSISKLASTNKWGVFVEPKHATTHTGGNETRPKNIALNFCIKVKNYF